MNFSVKGAQSDLSTFLFKLLEMLVLEESSYFSHNPWQFSQLKSGHNFRIDLTHPTNLRVTVRVKIRVKVRVS